MKSSLGKRLENPPLKEGGTSKSLTSDRAKQILKEGKVKGRRLTARQKGFFSFVAKGGSPKKYAEGGKIEGAGTPKSDSISAKIEDGTFIVPAENAEAAEALRAEYFPDTIGSKAELKNGGGVDVKLSDKEHMFSPEEAKVLTDNGVDLNKLAPNAEPGNKFAGGGEIDDNKKDGKKGDDTSVDKAKELEVLKKAYKELRTKAQNDFLNNDVINEDVTAKLNKMVTDINALEAEIKDTTGTDEKDGTPVDEKLEALEKERKALQIKTRGVGSAADRAKIKELTTAISVRKEEIKNGEIQLEDDSFTDAATRSATDAANKKEFNSDDLLKAKSMLHVKDPDKNTVGTTKNKKDTRPFVDQAGDDVKESFLSKAGPAGIAGGLQTTFGLADLLSQGKRPVDKISPELQSDYLDAKEEALYGLSPAERAAAEREITSARLDTQQATKESGTGAAQTFAQHQAILNRSNEANLRLTAVDRKVREAKRQRLSSLAGK